jgi:hypothetical protein
MFEQQLPIIETTPSVVVPPVNNKYKNILQPHSSSNTTEDNYLIIDQLLEREKLHNKTEAWTKIDKALRVQKLHQYAEKYGREHALPVKEIKALKAFFVACVDKNKLQKTKEVTYDKELREITAIPALHFNSQTHSFTLKNMDAKRVSTIKSLTPKRNNTEENT